MEFETSLHYFITVQLVNSGKSSSLKRESYTEYKVTTICFEFDVLWFVVSRQCEYGEKHPPFLRGCYGEEGGCEEGSREI